MTHLLPIKVSPRMTKHDGSRFGEGGGTLAGIAYAFM